MTDPVVADNTRRVRYVVTDPGGQDTFTITFPVVTLALDSGTVYGIEAYVDDALVDPVNYTVDTAAMKVVLDSAAAEGAVVVLDGATPAIRLLNYSLRGGLPSARLNQEANSFFYMIQELLRDRSRSVILSPSTGDDVSGVLPLPAAGQALAWNADANAFENGPTADEITNAQTYATQAAASDTSAAAHDASSLTNANNASASADAAAASAASIEGIAGKVLVDASDTTPGYLVSKLLITSALTQAIGSAGGNETLTLGLAGFFEASSTTVPTDCGIYRPAVNVLGLVAGGADVLRLAISGAGNRFKMLGRGSGSTPSLSTDGTDTNIGMILSSKGSGNLEFQTGGGEQLRILHTASSVNWLDTTGAATGNAPSITANGSDTNIGVTIKGRGTGGVAIKGTGTNDAAAAGYVGELIESSVLVADAVSLSNLTAADITSITLTAGEWDLWGSIVTAPAGTTTCNAIVGWISTTSATQPTYPNSGAQVAYQWTFTTGNGQAFPVGKMNLKLAATTTVYLGMKVGFGVSTMKGYGYLAARRVR